MGMKSKSIFLIVFVSLLLNIFHDFMITHQVETADVTKVELVKLDKKVHLQLDNLHDIFHFMAIITVPKIESTIGIQSHPLFLSTLSPFLIYETSFKPPKT